MLWKIYFWFNVLQIIMAFRVSIYGGFEIYDVVFFPTLILMLIGLQSYIYNYKYFTVKFWKIFFVFYILEICFYFYHLLKKLDDDFSNPDTRWFFISTFVLIILLELPNSYALYRCGNRKELI